MLTLVLSITLFLLLSAVMAAVDAAVLSVTLPEVDEMLLAQRPGARNLKLVKQRLTRAVVVIVILTNSINVIGLILVSQLAVKTVGTGAIGLVVIVLTLGTIVFSEIIPKSIGSHYSPTISRYAAGPIRLLQMALLPLVVSLEWLSALFTSGTRPIGTEEQIRSLTTIGRKAGFIEDDEGRLIHQAFVLNDRTAADIMTPLEKVTSLNVSQSIGEAAVVARESIYSRFPVFGETADDVEGTIMIRELLEASADDRHEDSVVPLIRPAFLVGADMPSDELLLAFRKRRSHLAIVRDHRRTVGLVTLEDVLEELVGEIEDEMDAELPENR